MYGQEGPRQRVEDIVERLSLLGLERSEAMVYVFLSMQGPQKASDVAAALKYHRTETYRLLQALVQQGFVNSTLGRPAKFEAVPPEQVFKELLAQQRARTEKLQRAQEELSGALSTLSRQAPQEVSRNTFKILQGRREVYRTLERMVQDARSTLLVLTTHPSAYSMAELAGIWDLAMERAEQGLEMRGILRTTTETRSRLRPHMERPNVHLRNLDTDVVIRFVVMDERELLLWVVSDPSSRLTADDDVAVWSDAVDFVRTQARLFESVWRESKDLRTIAAAEGLLEEQHEHGVRR